MSNDVIINSNGLILSPFHDQKELDWNVVVEQRHGSTEPLLVRVCEVNEDFEQDEADIKVGDELFLREVSMQHVRLCLEENYNNPEKPDNGAIVVPIKAGGKYQVCPHYNTNHTFNSVKELLDVYPFMSDLIFPEETFSIEGVSVPSWEVLQIVRMVQDTPLNQLLEVRIVNRNRHVLLPGSLQVKFLQWSNHSSLEGSNAVNKLKPRVYSLQELSEFFCSKWHPMMVKIHDDANGTHSNFSYQNQANKSPFTKKFFKFKKDKKVTDEFSSSKEDEDFWMIPDSWRAKPLVIEPIHVVKVTNPNTSAKMTLTGDLKLKVIRVSKRDQQASVQQPLPDVLVRGHTVLSSPHRPRSNSDTATPLDQLNIMSLRSNRERSDAIVAVVTSSMSSGSRQPSGLDFGTWVAFHRTRQVRKLLLRSQDSQYFLVSAHYAGEFQRLPLIFDCVGDAPIREEIVYITRCTAYPVQKQLDSCHEGQYVWFKKREELEIKHTSITVVHCMTSESIDGPQVPVTYPLDLRGRFERIDETATELSTRDLFRKELPICVHINKQDPGIGFDPLLTKRSFQVTKIVSELTVIIEILKKVDDVVKGTGTLIEIPVKRCSLFLRKAALKSEDPIRGIDPYPMRKDFKGLLKLPCVEMLAEIDVHELKDALRSISTYPMLSVLGKERETDTSSSQRSSLESSSSPAMKRKKSKISQRKPPYSTIKSKSFDNLSNISQVYVNFEQTKAQLSRSFEQLPSFEPKSIPMPPFNIPTQANEEEKTPTEIPKPKPRIKPKPMKKPTAVRSIGKSFIEESASIKDFESTLLPNGACSYSTRSKTMTNGSAAISDTLPTSLPPLPQPKINRQFNEIFQTSNDHSMKIKSPELPPKTEKTK